MFNITRQDLEDLSQEKPDGADALTEWEQLTGMDFDEFNIFAEKWIIANERVIKLGLQVSPKLIVESIFQRGIQLGVEAVNKKLNEDLEEESGDTLT